MRIFLVRHGETVWNRARRMQGRADSPLTLRGARLAEAYGRLLARELDGEAKGRTGFYVSPMGRTRQTASLIADCLGVDLDAFAVDPLLAEHDVGAFEGLGWPEIEARHGVTREDWRDWSTRPPGGETRTEVLARAQAWLAESRPHDIAVLVTHGGLSRTFRAAFLGASERGRVEMTSHDHGRVFVLEGGDVREIVVDDADHPSEAAFG